MKTKIIFSVLLLLAIAFTLAPSPCPSAVPSLINYQGVLKDSTGVPYHGPATMIFSIWDDSADGNKLWEETHPVVEVSHGLFNVLLGSADNPIPDSVFDQPNAWLDVLVNGSQLSPRRRIASVGYAFSDGDWTIDGDNIYREQGNVGIGTTSPSSKLEVAGDIKLSGSTDNTYYIEPAEDTAIIRIGNSDHFLGIMPNVEVGGNSRVKLVTGHHLYPIHLEAGGLFVGTSASYANPGDHNLIVADGKVGIGTTSPDYLLDIEDPTDHATLRVRTTGGDQKNARILITGGDEGRSEIKLGDVSDDNIGDIGYYHADNSLRFITNDTEKLRIDASGNVGIGTPSPQGKLDINGPLAVAGDVGTDGQVLKSQGPGANPTWASAGAGINCQEFTSSGTFVTPPGVTKVFITMVGAGGVGGAGIGSGGGGGGGGGGGCNVINYPFTVTPGNDYTVTIGSGGAGAPWGGSSGSDGGDTSFDTIIAPGGKGGLKSTDAVHQGAGGAGGGTASGRTDSYYGIPGQDGVGGVATNNGGVGGGSLFGTGGDGGSEPSGSGSNANGYGSGGGGGARLNGAGGDGADGYVLVTW